MKDTDWTQMYSYDAEMGVLGSMILSDRALTDCVARLKEDSFYRPAHRLIFRALRKLHDKGIALDILTIKQALTDDDNLFRVGGEDYLVELAEFVPSPSNSEYYADIVQEKAQRRAAYSILTKSAQKALSGDPLGEILEQTSTIEALTVPEKVPLFSLSDGSWEAGSVGLRTGWPSLDITSSKLGMPKGQLTLFGAYTGKGKSTAMLSSAIYQAENGARVLYATFADLNRHEIMKRALRMICGWSKRPNSLIENQKFDDAIFRMSCWDFDVYDLAESHERVYAEAFSSWVLINQPTRKWDVIYVDYAQEMESTRVREATEVAHQNACARAIARMAARLPDTAVGVGVQLTLGQKEGQDAVAYSKVWEQVCGWDLRIKDDGFLVRKSRFRGSGSLVPVMFNRDFDRYDDKSGLTYEDA